MRRISGRVLLRLALVGFLAACGSSITIKLPEAGGIGGPSATPPRGFSLLYSPADWAFARAIAPDPLRRGERSERFELRDADCGGSDCGNSRARAQIIQDRGASSARVNRDFWAGWSFYNASIGAVAATTSLGTVVGEWKIEGEAPALFRFIQLPADARGWRGCAANVCDPSGPANADVVVELDAIATAAGWGAAQNRGRVCRLFNMAQARGRWTDIVVNTNFGNDGFGYLKVWVDGTLRCDYKGQIAVAGRGTPTHRRGIFNSNFTRWSAATPKPTLIAYYDEYLEGSARGDVDTAARQAAGLPAAD